jgi:hypothetical protein
MSLVLVVSRVCLCRPRLPAQDGVSLPNIVAAVRDRLAFFRLDDDDSAAVQVRSLEDGALLQFRRALRFMF